MLFQFDFGPRSDHLQEGPRPVVVVQTNALNRLMGYPNTIVVPLTTKMKPSATYVKISPGDGNELTSDSWAISNQIFTLDKSRLQTPLGRISQAELFQLKEALKIALSIR
jgi:mRNA-degrading endonuclease toxin of MazEF toxin-antitoxin module